MESRLYIVNYTEAFEVEAMNDLLSLSGMQKLYLEPIALVEKHVMERGLIEEKISS